MKGVLGVFDPGGSSGRGARLLERLLPGPGRVSAPMPGLAVPAGSDAAAGARRGAWSAVRVDGPARTATLAGDPSESAVLYWAVLDGLLLFSDSLASLAGIVRPRRDAAALAEFLLCRDFISPDRTPYEGVRRVPPGGTVSCSPEGIRAEGALPEFLCGEDDPGLDPAAVLLQSLSSAVEEAVVGEDRVGVLLSGGMDSSILAALACRALGKDRVTALTYEFDDPGYPSEAPAGRDLASFLGIRHEVVRLSFDALAAELEGVFEALELPVSGALNMTRLPAVLRRFSDLGCGRALSGYGMDVLLGYVSSHDRMLFELASAAAKGLPEDAVSAWRRTRFPGDGAAAAPGPGWPVPHESIYHQVVAGLVRAGLARDAASFYPRALGRLAAAASPPEEPGAEALPLYERLRLPVYRSVASSRLMRLKGRLGAAFGCGLLAPAFLPGPMRSSALFQRRLPGELPPGRALLKRCFAGLMPERFLALAKTPHQGVMPRPWEERLNAELGAGGRSLEGLSPEEESCLGRWLSPNLVQARRWFCGA